MGKFFNGRVNNNREKIVKFGIIAGGIIIIIIIISLIIKSNNKKNEERLEIKENIQMEINGEFPKATDYFSIIENCDPSDIEVNVSNVDKTKLGSYEVNLKSKTLEGTAILQVVDTTPPELLVGDLEISEGEGYSVNDFLVSCEDNSKEECIVEFYKGENEQTDYSLYTEAGTYEIKIVAKDSSGNESEIKTVNLNINNESTPEPQCKYGDLTANIQTSYPVAVIVGNKDTGCAINRDLWDNEETKKVVDELYKEDYNKLKADVDSYIKSKYPNGSKIVAYPHYIAVLNEDYKGLIGYAIYVKIYMADTNYTGKIDSDENLKLAYYIKSDKTRQYDINEIGLK